MPTFPSRVLSFVLSNMTPIAFWEGDDAWTGYPYKWTATLNVAAQPHGSPDTPTPYFYDGNDVIVGDYVATSGRGRVLKIVAIASKTSSGVNCTLEDEARVNTLNDDEQLGNGGIQEGEGLLFTVENGWPILHPLPDALGGSLPAYFATDIISRFMRYRPDTVNAVSADEKGQPGGVATLDSTTGKLPEDQIPALAVTETVSVASEENMLALEAQIGDIAIRTDVNKTYILSQSDPTILSNWLEVLAPGGSLSTLNDVNFADDTVRGTLVFNPETGLWETTEIGTLLDGGGF